jgi:hypothetical protein
MVASLIACLMPFPLHSLWDGLLSGTDRIMVLGATNRPNDIDSAILRRMPKRFGIGLPNLEQRTKILNLVITPIFSVEASSHSGFFVDAERHETVSRFFYSNTCRTNRRPLGIGFERIVPKCSYGSRARIHAKFDGQPRRIGQRTTGGMETLINTPFLCRSNVI